MHSLIRAILLGVARGRLRGAVAVAQFGKPIVIPGKRGDGTVNFYPVKVQGKVNGQSSG